MTSAKRDTFIPPADSSMSPRVRNQEISSNSTEQRENSEGEKSSPRRSYSGKFLQHVNEVANAAIAPIKSAFEFLTNTAVSGLICDDQLAREWQQRNQGTGSQLRHSDDGLQRRRTVPLNSTSSKTNPQSFVRRSTGAIHKDKKLDTLLSPRSTSEQAHPVSASNLEESDEEDDNMSYYTCADTLGLDGKTAARPSFAADSEIFEETSEVWNEPGEQPSTEHDTKNSAPKENIPERESTELNKNAPPERSPVEKKRFHRYVSFSAAHEDFRRGSGDQEALAEAASQPGFEMASVSTLRKQALQNDHESRQLGGDSYSPCEENATAANVGDESAGSPSSLPNVSGHYQDRRLASYPNDAEPVTPDGYRVKDEFLDETGPPQNMSFFKIVREVFKDVRKGGDLTSISVPASLLEPVSACEKVTRIMQRGELLQEIVRRQDPLERFLQVVTFILSGLPKEKFSKKPYNPILGETFQCAFEHRDGGGRTFLISEQVSHHPPITAVHLRNDTLGIRMTSYTEPEAKFWGNSIEIKLKGKIRFYLVNFDEEYISNRTSLILSGILGIGKFRAEWRGPLHIYCEKTGYEAKLEFKGTTFMGLLGEANAVEGKIVQRRKEGPHSEVSEQKLFSVEGSWDHQIRIKNVAKKTDRVLFDYDDIAKRYRMKLLLPPPEALEETNSLYVWEGCTRAILEGNSRLAAEEKHKVEEEQRRLRRERMQQGIQWEPKYFRRSSDGEGYEFREETAERLFHGASNMSSSLPS